MIRRLSSLCVLVAVVRAAPAPAHAQSQAGANADSVFARARRLVASGNGAAGRLLVDSVLAATDPNTPQYADALYWRATLSTNGADAERDYRRIVVEYGASARSGDALLQLAQLESARGDRATRRRPSRTFSAREPGACRTNAGKSDARAAARRPERSSARLFRAPPGTARGS